ncbi:unnamed protein product [Gadus morhua 'NCC']
MDSCTTIRSVITLRGSDRGGVLRHSERDTPATIQTPFSEVQKEFPTALESEVAVGCGSASAEESVDSSAGLFNDDDDDASGSVTQEGVFNYLTTMDRIINPWVFPVSETHSGGFTSKNLKKGSGASDVSVQQRAIRIPVEEPRFVLGKNAVFPGDLPCRSSVACLRRPRRSSEAGGRALGLVVNNAAQLGGRAGVKPLRAGPHTAQVAEQPAGKNLIRYHSGEDSKRAGVLGAPPVESAPHRSLSNSVQRLRAPLVGVLQIAMLHERLHKTPSEVTWTPR